MKCNEVRERLELFVLGGLPDSEQERLQAHLDTCPECFARFAEYQFVLEEMQAQCTEPSPDPVFEDRARKAISQEIRSKSASRWKSGLMLAAASLAVVSLAVLGFYFAFHFNSGPIVSADRLAGLVERWQQDGLLATPHSDAPGYALRDSTIFALRERDGRSCVCAFDANSGEELWQSKLAALGYVSVDARRVYALARGSNSGIDLLALDSSNGELLWRCHHDDVPLAPVLTRPLPGPDETVCWAVSNAIRMLDAASGEPVWSREASCRGPLSTPAMKGDSVVVSGPDAIMCLSASDGGEQWQLSLPDQARGQARPLLALSGSHAYFAQRHYVYGAELFCLDLEKRQIEWQRSVEEAFHLLTAGRTVCLRGRDIKAFDAGSGQILWTRRADGCGPLTKSGSLVQYVDSGDPGRIVAVDASTGTQGWQIAGVRSCDAFTRRGSTGFVKTRQGVLRAFALRDLVGR